MSAELHPQFCLVLQWSAHSLCDHCRVLSAFLIVALQSLVACLKKTEGFTPAINENAIS